MDAYGILVIILSITLAVFLILSIILVTQVMRLVQSLRQIVAKGEQLVDTAEDIGTTLRKNAGAAMLVKMLTKFVANATKDSKR